MADDRYDHAIDYLMRHPMEIINAWGQPDTHRAGCLFARAHRKDCYNCHHGCLTQIRGYCGYPLASWNMAATPTLTTVIRADQRIPGRVEDIQLHHLPVFAEWQRRLDRELHRTEVT